MAAHPIYVSLNEKIELFVFNRNFSFGCLAISCRNYKDWSLQRVASGHSIMRVNF